MTELFLDIETCPASDPELLSEIRARHQVPPLDLSSIVAAGNIKDPDKIAADLEKKRAKATADHEAALAGVEAAIDQAIRKTAIDTSVAQIVCVAWAFDDEPVQSVEGLDEADLLRRFWAAIRVGDMLHYESCGSYEKLNWQREKAPTVVAHNSGFDVRGLWRRSIINRVRPPDWWPVAARPWDESKIRDTMTMWEGVGGRISLDRLCRLLGLAGKGAIDGSMVWDLVREGRLDDVAAYCRDDVAERLRPVYRILTGAGWNSAPATPKITAPALQIDDSLPDWATAGGV